MKKPIELMLVETMSALVAELRELRKSVDENTKLVKESATLAKRDRAAMIAEREFTNMRGAPDADRHTL